MTGSDRAAGAPAVVGSRLRHVHLPRRAERAPASRDPATGVVAYRHHPFADERIDRAGRRERGGPW